MRGGNAARYDAPDELVRSAAALDFGSEAPPPNVRLARAKTFFNVLETTFFRLFDIPDKVTGDSMTLTLNQLGSTAKLPLQMAKHGDRWFIVVPDDVRLAELAKALYAAAAERRPTPPTTRRATRRWTPTAPSPAPSSNGTMAGAPTRSTRSGIPPAIRDYQGALAAQYIAGVLNRVGLPEPQEIPDDPKSGEPYVLFSHPAGQIAIAPVGTGKPTTWVFTRETVENARRLFVVVEDLPVVAGWTLPQPHSAFFALRRSISGVEPWL